jgi:hypothetical protein
MAKLLSMFCCGVCRNMLLLVCSECTTCARFCAEPQPPFLQPPRAVTKKATNTTNVAYFFTFIFPSTVTSFGRRPAPAQLPNLLP